MTKTQAPLQYWRVVDIHGNPENIEAHFLFIHETTGDLNFRFKDANDSYVVATYSSRGYSSCINMTDKRKPVAPDRDQRDYLPPHRRRGPNPASIEDEIPF